MPPRITAFFLVLGIASTAAAEPEIAVRDSTVYVDGTARWSGRKVFSRPVLSEDGGAVAFTGRDVEGKNRLVVLIVDEKLEPISFSWAIPRDARAVTWLGEGRLGAGPTELHPTLIVNYSLED